MINDVISAAVNLPTCVAMPASSKLFAADSVTTVAKTGNPAFCIFKANSLASLVPAKNRIILISPKMVQQDDDHDGRCRYGDHDVHGHDHGGDDVRDHVSPRINDNFLGLDFHLICLQPLPLHVLSKWSVTLDDNQSIQLEQIHGLGIFLGNQITSYSCV